MSGPSTRAIYSVVLADANILYSRVLRDYFLYAMTQQLIRVMWSTEILDEVVEHLVENVASFDAGAGRRLVAAMNGAFPYSLVEVSEEAMVAAAPFRLTDDDDRHVIAAALAAEATFLCSDDRTGFPPEVMAAIGIEHVTADELLSRLISEAPGVMLKVHAMAVSQHPAATDESTVAALLRANAARTAKLMEGLLGPR
ncbi:PIN domain-containing protein [Kribbia dieselivorans]|uniref:PIN domain-containing protein n=1 Tax=Kribbia dieselivorans TaxID=331526 RepID=UPI0008381C38|nr:PIN domain-containing protein [Kribbia dieselivorans]